MSLIVLHEYMQKLLPYAKVAQSGSCTLFRWLRARKYDSHPEIEESCIFGYCYVPLSSSVDRSSGRSPAYLPHLEAVQNRSKKYGPSRVSCFNDQWIIPRYLSPTRPSHITKSLRLFDGPKLIISLNLLDYSVCCNPSAPAT